MFYSAKRKSKIFETQILRTIVNFCLYDPGFFYIKILYLITNYFLEDYLQNERKIIMSSIKKILNDYLSRI